MGLWMEKTFLPPSQTQTPWARGASRGPPVRQEGGRPAWTEASVLCRETRRSRTLPDSPPASTSVRVLLGRRPDRPRRGGAWGRLCPFRGRGLGWPWVTGRAEAGQPVPRPGPEDAGEASVGGLGWKTTPARVDSHDGGSSEAAAQLGGRRTGAPRVRGPPVGLTVTARRLRCPTGPRATSRPRDGPGTAGEAANWCRVAWFGPLGVVDVSIDLCHLKTMTRALWGAARVPPFLELPRGCSGRAIPPR